MTNPTFVTVNAKTAEGMPRREFIRKSLVASGGAFAGMAIGEKMALPELYNGTSSSSSSRNDDSRTNSSWCWWSWCQ